MRLVGSGDIWRKFLEADEDTIIRRPNLRRFARDNGVEHYVMGDKWLISEEDFFKTINPRNISIRATMPRIRTKASAVREWNDAHKRIKIDKHIVDICMQDPSVFKFKRDNVWIINYDQLLPVLVAFMKENEYIPQAKRIQKKKYGFKGRKRTHKEN